MAKIYVADLAAYNEGKLIGEWLNLDDYSSGSEVMDAINEVMEKWSKEQGEEREEYAIHDKEDLPDSFYSESMGESEFDAYYEAKEVADEIDIPIEVLLEWMGDHGVDDPSTARDAYQGKYDDMEDFAYRMVEEGVLDAGDNVYVSDTDRRIIAGEEADNLVDDLDDDDAIERADMQEELSELEQKQSDYEDDEDEDKEEFDFDEEKEKLVDKAKEKLKEEIYEQWEEGLKDPIGFLVDEQGMYSKEDLLKASFIQVDYESLGKDLSMDYDEIRYDGDSYIFSNNYSSGGAIPKKEKGGTATTNEIEYQDVVVINEPHINSLLNENFNDKSISLKKQIKNAKRLFGVEGIVSDVSKNFVTASFNSDSVTFPISWVNKVSERIKKKGGKVSFDDKVSAIENRLVGQSVPRKYRKQYGDTYTKETAHEAALRIAGSIAKNEKYEDGGKPIGSTGLFEKGGKFSQSGKTSVESNQYLPNGFGKPAKTYYYIVDSEGKTFHHSDGKFRKNQLKEMTTYAYYDNNKAEEKSDELNK